jgi:hypothetical protein
MPHAKKIFLHAILDTCATGSSSMPYMKCFHDNEFCCSQNKLLCEQQEVDYHLEQCTSSHAVVTKCHSKWWSVIMWLLSVHMVVWDLSDFRLGQKMKEVHCLVSCSAVSLVERHHYRWAYCLHLVPWRKESFFWKDGAVLPDCTASQDSNVHENITSHKMQEVSLHDNMSSTRYPNKGVCHVKSLYVVCVPFGKHTFTQASVDHYGLPCVVADTNLGAWCLVSGWRQVGRGDNMQRWCLLQDLQVCIISSAKPTKAKDVSLA